MDDGLGQVELGLGQPDELDGPGRGVATSSESGSASPMSSEARITSRRAMNRASSPASSMGASQYRPASGSEPRMLLMKAEMTS